MCSTLETRGLMTQMLAWAALSFCCSIVWLWCLGARGPEDGSSPALSLQDGAAEGHGPAGKLNHTARAVELVQPAGHLEL